MNERHTQTNSKAYNIDDDTHDTDVGHPVDLGLQVVSGQGVMCMCVKDIGSFHIKCYMLELMSMLVLILVLSSIYD